MARIDAAAIRIDQQWVGAADVVDAAVAHIGHALKGRALRVDAGTDMAVEVDPRLVSVALSHLLENAARYSPADREILVLARVEQDGLHVSVSDDGPGLDPDELDHLFERFYRGRSARQATFGTGMGLSITRGLLAAVGGRVWAENVPGAGARFTLVVPGPVRIRRGGALGMAARILIVDDEPNIIGTVTPLLQGRGYDVLAAMTGRAALESVARDTPDLVVLDLGLPDLDGVEVCRRLRLGSSIPIVVLSARGAEGDKVRALDAGADDYVTKPFRF